MDTLNNLSTIWRIIDAWRSIFGEYAGEAFIIALLVVVLLLWRLLVLLQRSGSLLFDLVMLSVLLVVAFVVDPENRIYVWCALGILIALRIAIATRTVSSPPQVQK